MPFTHVGGVAGKSGTIAMQQKIGKLRKRIAELEQVVVERNQRIRQLRTENKKLREYSAYLLDFIEPTAHQSGCNRRCPAYKMCVGSTRCMFVDWAMERARELGIEVGK